MRFLASEEPLPYSVYKPVCASCLAQCGVGFILPAHSEIRAMSLIRSSAGSQTHYLSSDAKDLFTGMH